MEVLLAHVESDGMISWGYDIGCARVSFGDRWELAMKAHLGSLDAAIALHKAVLSEWCWSVGQYGSSNGLVSVGGG